MSDIALSVARILECTEQEYHADPCDVPSLSNSIAVKMLNKSPLHGWAAHPKLGGSPGPAAVAEEGDDGEEEEGKPESTAAQKNGQLIHKLMLGKGVDVVIVDAKSFQTKYAKAIRDEALAAGKLPVIAHKHEKAEAVAAKLRRRCADAGYPLDGMSEVAIEWREAGDNGPVVCRCRMDNVSLETGVILDVKSSRDAHPDKCAKRLLEYGYDVQATCYPRALAALRPELSGRIRFTLLYVETTPPYAVVPAYLDGGFREIGKIRWLEAVRVWERCLASGVWPSYCERAVPLSPPAWVAAQWLGTEGATQ